jgi:transcriptional regulator with XRE-family HTH domain
MDTLPNIIKELRAQGKTQEEVGDLLGLSQEYVSNIERGKGGTRTPAETLMRCIAVRDGLRETQ